MRYNSKFYQNINNNGFGNKIVVETGIGKILSEKLSFFTIGEIQHILTEQLRVNLNMVKCTPEELINPEYYI